VVISAPSDDADATFVPSVNDDGFDAERHLVVSAASCTTNCLAPVAKVLHERFGIEYLLMSTIHAYTSSQALVDKPTRKRRRGRAAAVSIVPTTTGAAKATELVLPALEGRMDGMAYRVPVEDGSVIDAVARLETDVTVDDVVGAFEEAADGDLRGALRVSRDALVSRDVIGDPHGAIVDAEATMVLRDRVAKVVAWYDNEWGYAARMIELAHLVGSAA
jgi:glyceraldehyde-3-phosphate dehydrogenase type I